MDDCSSAASDPLFDSRNPNHGRSGGLRDSEPQAAPLRFALVDALDSPTVQAIARIISFRNQDFSKGLSEQLADVLEPRLSVTLARPHQRGCA